MSRKRFVIDRKIEPIEIVFEDGEVKYALINAPAMAHLGRRNKDLEALSLKPWEYASELLFVGMYEYDPSTTLDEARAVVVNAGPDLIKILHDSVMDTFNVVADDKTKAIFEQRAREINAEIERDVANA